MSKKQRRQLSKFEKLLYTFTLIIILCFPVCLLFSQTKLTKINYEVERTKKTINKQEKVNENIQMKINELVSLEKLENVAKEMGLSYTNSNIKTVE